METALYLIPVTLGETEIARVLPDYNTGVIAATSHEEKPSLTLMYTDDLTAKGSNAGKDIREAAKLINGGGGGQPFLATAGGKNMDGLNAAFDKLIETATK